MRRCISILLGIILLIFTLPILIVQMIGRESPEKKIEQQQVTGKEPMEEVLVYFSDEDVSRSTEFSEYLKCVVAAEMPASFHIEALKAQAVAARTYIVEKAKNGDGSHKDGAAVCTDSAHCKAWISKEQALANWGGNAEHWEKISGAVNSTAGEIVTYEEQPIQAVFHSTSSGRTEKAADIWGNDLPYLQSVDSPGDLEAPRFSSSLSVDVEKAKEMLGIGSLEIGEISSTESGTVKKISIGGKEFDGTEIRNIFGLRSANFILTQSENDLLFEVKGSGHGVGMSQYGANYLAGEGKSYKEILETYYTNAVVENFK